MTRFAWFVLATWFLTACPGPRSPAPSGEDAMRISIAHAEVTRGKAVDELMQRATTGEPSVRMLALRALGRLGSERVMPTLVAALHDADPQIVATAAGAIGVAAQLDESEASAEITAELVSARMRVSPELQPVVLEAIGRAGDRSAQRALIPTFGSSPAVVEASALALARYGRRKIPLDAAARTALIPLLDGPPEVRYAATYALGREHEPPIDVEPALVMALIARLDDVDPQTRAQALIAIGKRKLLDRARDRVGFALLDRDWRVAVEAVRVLVTDDAGRDAIAAELVRRHAAIAKDPRYAQIVIEAARALGPHASRPAVKTGLSELAVRAAPLAPTDLAQAWIHCLALAGVERTAAAPSYRFVDACKLPEHLRLPLVVGLVSEKVGSLAQRRAALADLLEQPDARVRAAGLGALVELWDESPAEDHRAALATLIAAIGSPDAMFAGAAIEAAPAFFDKLAADERLPLDEAIVRRAQRERDAELSASILELVGARSIMEGRRACRAGLTGHPVRAKAARSCLRALGETPPPAELEPLATPPHDVAQVIGTRLVWRLSTSRGDLEIALRPDVAPWAVAAIVGLTKRGFYDGLEFHRVVGNFVVQGGDPTMSGWGGPGFTLPSEPATLADGPGFMAGGVGIADAGRDSGGSQWFVMHGRAAHLDGRYTWIGTVTSGQNVADALVIGDKVTKATVSAVPAQAPVAPALR